MATTVRERELKEKAAKVLKTSEDPIEILRAKCLARGANGIRGLSRFVVNNSSFKLKTSNLQLD